MLSLYPRHSHSVSKRRMKLFILPVLVLFDLTFFASDSVQINYVISNNDSLPHICESEVCLTLDEYAQQASHYFVSGSIIEFLAGSHVLQHTVSVTDVENLTLTGDPFPANSSSKIVLHISKEAVFAFIRSSNVTINNLDFCFFTSAVLLEPLQLFSIESSTISIVNTMFERLSGNISLLIASTSTLEIVNSTFKGFFAYVGAAIKAIGSEVTASGSYFISNEAKSTGGVIYCEESAISLERTYFKNNSAAYGGVIGGTNCNLNITDSAFTGNSALYYGGALYFGKSTVILSGWVLFYNNKALHGNGGAVAICSSHLQTEPNSYLNFTENAAAFGGAIGDANCDNSDSKIELSGYFINNTAVECGGAMHCISTNMEIKNTYIVDNNGSALCFQYANVSFSGETRLGRNTGIRGGAVNSMKSTISFLGPVNKIGFNYAYTGGAIYSVYSKISFRVNTLFGANKASTDGGALYALGSDITLSNSTVFNRNSADNGGAMYFEQSASLKFDTSSRTYTYHNHAREYGGVIYARDIASRSQCSHEDSGESSYLSFCFISLNSGDLRQNSIKVYSSNDSTDKDGAFLYGGLLDRCQYDEITDTQWYAPYERMRRYILRTIVKEQNTTVLQRVPEIQSGPKKTVTSQPGQLCLCEDNSTYNCSIGKTVFIYKGQKLNLPLIALDQTSNPVSTTVKVLKSSNTRLLPNQNPQPLQGQCSELAYNIYSNDTREQLTLYPDGPCRELGLSGFSVDVEFLSCPNGFNESGDHCICEQRLQEYADCFIDDSIYMLKKPDSRFWMGAEHSENGTYEGLILYRTCPADYCTGNQSVRLNLENLDIQCSSERSGMLCGSCATNYSLTLGNSRCQLCSNWHVFLLLVFAGAGIILVIFLSVLRLTISTGFLNSIILYSNIVQVNRTIFFTESSGNILTVFVAWINLDFGFQACFFSGMDAYHQTWLQFAFPLYVWFLVGLIILISRYSITVSKMIGHNPIAVLATVILMSYTKILKIIIEVFSFVELEYPDDRKAVWLKDANVPYLESKHLALTVVTVLVLAFFFLPYTLLLLLGYKLYRFSGTRCIHPLLMKLKPFLDAYYAPFKPRTRYWTGFLLLVRCALYIVFSYNSLGGTRKSLLAISIVFTALLIINWLSVYKTHSVTVVEGCVFLNLVILSTSALAGLDSQLVVYLLVGAVFVTTLSVIAYHFHITYTAKSAIWKKLEVYIGRIVEGIKNAWKGNKETDQTQAVDIPHTSNSPQANSKSIIDLREPLLENVN